MSLESKLLLAVIICAVVLSASAVSINWLISNQARELAGWGGWVAAAIFRLASIISLGAVCHYFNGLHPEVDLNLKVPLLTGAVIVMVSMMLDVMLSTRRLRKVEEHTE